MGIIDSLPAFGADFEHDFDHLGSVSVETSSQDILDVELVLEVISVELMISTRRLMQLEEQLFGNSAIPPITVANSADMDDTDFTGMYSVENTLSQLGKLREFIIRLIGSDNQRSGAINFDIFKQIVLSLGASLLGETSEVLLEKLAHDCYERFFI